MTRVFATMGLWGLLAVPAAVFMLAIAHFSVNIPLYDDITQILWVINSYVDAGPDGTPPGVHPIQGKLGAIFYPNAGHVPMLTRLFALAQYYGLGSIDFYMATLVTGGLWVVTVAFIITRLQREELPLHTLLPLPFLLFSLAQWEAMVMMLGAIQMYIGTLFIPVLTLYAITRSRPLLAAAGFAVALFTSSGALAVLPLALAYFLLSQQWRPLMRFTAFTVPTVILFNKLNYFGHTPDHVLERLPAIVRFVRIFLGNIVTNGSFDPGTMAQTHLLLGSCLLVAGALLFVLVRGQHFARLLLVYVLMLAVITALVRGGEGGGVVSRYAPFALLGTAMVYILLQACCRQRWPALQVPLTVVVLVVCAVTWYQNALHGRDMLARYREMRVVDMRNYIASGDARQLLWDPDWCADILNKSRRLGVYDYLEAAGPP